MASRRLPDRASDAQRILRWGTSREIPVVMATAVADFAAAAEAMQAGAVDYLVKPILPELFLAAIDRGLSRRTRPRVQLGERLPSLRVRLFLLRVSDRDCYATQASGDPG